MTSATSVIWYGRGRRKGPMIQFSVLLIFLLIGGSATAADGQSKLIYEVATGNELTHRQIDTAVRASSAGEFGAFVDVYDVPHESDTGSYCFSDTEYFLSNNNTMLSVERIITYFQGFVSEHSIATTSTTFRYRYPVNSGESLQFLKLVSGLLSGEIHSVEDVLHSLSKISAAKPRSNESKSERPGVAYWKEGRILTHGVVIELGSGEYGNMIYGKIAP